MEMGVKYFLSRIGPIIHNEINSAGVLGSYECLRDFLSNAHHVSQTVCVTIEGVYKRLFRNYQGVTVINWIDVEKRHHDIVLIHNIGWNLPVDNFAKDGGF